MTHPLARLTRILVLGVHDDLKRLDEAKELARIREALELLSDAAMLPAGDDSSGDAPKGLRRDERRPGEAPEDGS